MYLYVLKSIQDSHKVGGLETVKLHKRITHSSPWNNTFCCKEIIVTSNDDESSLFVRCAKTSVNDRIYKSISSPVNELSSAFDIDTRNHSLITRLLTIKIVACGRETQRKR